MKNITLALLATLMVLFSFAETNETGVNIDFSYSLNGAVISLTDNSIITETDTLAVWDIFWQVKANDTVRKVAHRVQQPSDSIYNYTYSQAGYYTVTLIYQKWYLGSNGNPGYNGGSISKSLNIPIGLPMCVSPSFTISNNGLDYTFTNTTQLNITNGYNIGYMWVVSDNSTSYGNIFNHSFSDTGTYYIHLIQQISTNDSIVCTTVNTDTFYVADFNTGLGNVESSNVKVFWNGNRIIIEPLHNVKSYSIYNTIGQKINEEYIIDRGLHIIYVETTTEAVTRKVVID